MKIEELSLTDLKNGYTKSEHALTCILCEKEFEPNDDMKIKEHIQAKHGSYTNSLIDLDSKYNSLTKKQKDLLKLFASEKSDKEIAKEKGVAYSTIRHQRFQFREKAKQAKLYLAIYENVFSKEKPEEAFIPIHATANMLDERYMITKKEQQATLKTSFTSLLPLTLKSYPRKEKKKVIVLSKITEVFQLNQIYTEKEVNTRLKEIYDDYSTLRRYLVDYGFLERTESGEKYWLAK